jgi:hypothetical protein
MKFMLYLKIYVEFKHVPSHFIPFLTSSFLVSFRARSMSFLFHYLASHVISRFIPCLVHFINCLAIFNCLAIAFLISLIAWPFHFSLHSVPAAFHFHFINCLAILFVISFRAFHFHFINCLAISFLISFRACCISFSFH